MGIKMNTFIDIISTTKVKDTEGFVNTGDTILASVRAYKEDKNGSERWANMAVFSEASVIFQFRKIPDVTIDTTLYIVCDDGRYRIIGVENIRDMYISCICEKVEGSVY